MVREMFMKESGVKDSKNFGARALELYMRGHLYRQFHHRHVSMVPPMRESLPPRPGSRSPHIDRVASLLRKAQRPALVVGSQALVNRPDPHPIADAVHALGVPTWLGGMARGLLGRDSDIQFRHKRSAALKEADLVVIAGFPFDFRMSYGRSISSRATVVAANLSSSALRKNRRPEIPIHMHPGDFLQQLGSSAGGGLGPWSDWFDVLRARELERDEEINEQARESSMSFGPASSSATRRSTSKHGHLRS
jgi:acetolactate synthase-1/2/3 large subunit